MRKILEKKDERRQANGENEEKQKRRTVGGGRGGESENQVLGRTKSLLPIFESLGQDLESLVHWTGSQDFLERTPAASSKLLMKQKLNEMEEEDLGWQECNGRHEIKKFGALFPLISALKRHFEETWKVGIELAATGWWDRHVRRKR